MLAFFFYQRKVCSTFLHTYGCVIEPRGIKGDKREKKRERMKKIYKKVTKFYFPSFSLLFLLFKNFQRFFFFYCNEIAQFNIHKPRYFFTFYFYLTIIYSKKLFCINFKQIKIIFMQRKKGKKCYKIKCRFNLISSDTG